MTIEVSSPSAAAEGTALLPPRAFGETNTLTVPRTRRGPGGRGVLTRGTAALPAADPMLSTRVAIVAADPSSLTITF
jgi:hypothetical protein